MIRGLAVLASARRGDVVPCGRRQIAGVETLVARPSEGSGPVVVFANAATSRGIDEPLVGRVLGSIACAGFVALAPELPHVKNGELTGSTVQALVSVCRATGSPIALVGASMGGGLVILAAAHPSLADHVSIVAAIAPFASLRSMLRLATTGYYGEQPFAAEPLVGRAAVRSLAASAPEDPAVEALLANRDPNRFDALYAELAPATRVLVEELSPVTRMRHVRAPVELVSAPDDRFLPVGEARALACAGRDVHLTVTHGLEHVRPRLHPGLLRVAGVLDRTLRRAAHAEHDQVELEPLPAP